LSPPEREPRTWRAVSWVLVTLAALAGLWYGYAFGERLGGLFLGVLLAVVAAVLTSVLVDGAIDWLARTASRRDDRR
jgi:zinc transporter ZupT